jgi:hypothetical protein
MLPKFFCFGGMKMLEIPVNQEHLMFRVICFRSLSALSVNPRDFCS